MLCVQITQAAVRDFAKVRQNRTEMFQGSYYRVKTQHKQCKQVSGECTYDLLWSNESAVPDKNILTQVISKDQLNVQKAAAWTEMSKIE